MPEVYHDLEEPLLPGEEADLARAVAELFGEQWLHGDNALLGGRAPQQLIGTDEEYKLRNLLRSVTISGLS